MFKSFENCSSEKNSQVLVHIVIRNEILRVSGDLIKF